MKNANVDSLQDKISAKKILKGETAEQKEKAARKHDFVNEVATKHSELTADGRLLFEILPDSLPKLSLSPSELQSVTPTGPDPLADEIRRRFNDIPPTLSLNQMIENLANSIKSSRKKADATHPPIPTNLEIDALKVLWEQTVATPSDIYAQLDSSWRGTSEDLVNILESMADRGLLGREKISPSHEFGLFGLAKIELSSKNRKNQVYMYWPLIPKERLIRYIDAQRYLAFSAAQEQSTNGHTTQTYQHLEDKLLRLLQ